MALNIENIIAEIKEASILELNDLVKAIEEEFGVTAAAPVAVAAAGGAEEAAKDSSGLQTKMDKALFSDMVGTTIGAIAGTSNVTTYVESAAGIEAGGRTGLTALVVAALFVISSFFSPLLAIVPTVAVAPILIIVGIMMLSSMKDIEWDDLSEAVPAFFTSVFMGFTYSITHGIAAGFIMYAFVKIIKGEAKEVHPIIWVLDALFILNFISLALA